MLVLSRRTGERVCIGDGIVVTVMHTVGNRVQLGIEAPREVPVDREEVLLRKLAEMIPGCECTPLAKAS